MARSLRTVATSFKQKTQFLLRLATQVCFSIPKNPYWLSWKGLCKQNLENLEFCLNKVQYWRLLVTHQFIFS